MYNLLQGMGNLCGTICQVLAHDEHFFHGEPTCLFETLDTHGTIEWSSPCPLCWVRASGQPVKGSLLCWHTQHNAGRVRPFHDVELRSEVADSNKDFGQVIPSV
jgi:hypothetical protein